MTASEKQEVAIRTIMTRDGVIAGSGHRIEWMQVQNIVDYKWIIRPVDYFWMQSGEIRYQNLRVTVTRWCSPDSTHTSIWSTDNYEVDGCLVQVEDIQSH